MCSCCCKTLLGARWPGFCLPNVPGLNGFVQPAIVTRSQGYRAAIPRSNCLLIAKIFRKLRIFWSERPFLSGSVRLVYLVYEASGGGWGVWPIDPMWLMVAPLFVTVVSCSLANVESNFLDGFVEKNCRRNKAIQDSKYRIGLMPLDF